MTLPVPPSDSLYKFCAIGGIMIVALSLYLPWQIQSERDIAILENNLSIEKLRIESEGLKRASEHRARVLEDLDVDPTKVERLQEMLNRNNRTKKKYIDPNELKNQLEELRTQQAESVAKLEKALDLVAQAERDVDQYSLINVQMKTLLDTSKVLIERADGVNQFSLITLGIGIIMVSFGFWNWYWKSQVHQDRIAQNQAAQWPVPQPLTYKSEEIPG